MSITKRILVCGGRDYRNCDHIWVVLDSILKCENIHIIEGGQVSKDKITGELYGADYFASTWAKARGTEHTKYPANWGRFGRRAGFIRNKQMLEQGKPDLVLAFGGGSGTDMMVRLARNAGVPVLEFDRDKVSQIST